MGNEALTRRGGCGRTLEMERAADALEKVQQIKERSDAKAQERYVRYVERLPAMILTNGLGQAMAFLLQVASREKTEEYRWLYENLQDWLCRPDDRAPYKGAESLIDAIINGERDAYIRAQREALAWLEWHKKLAVGFLANPERSKEDAAS